MWKKGRFYEDRAYQKNVLAQTCVGSTLYRRYCIEPSQNPTTWPDGRLPKKNVTTLQQLWLVCRLLRISSFTFLFYVLVLWDKHGPNPNPEFGWSQQISAFVRLFTTASQRLTDGCNSVARFTGTGMSTARRNQLTSFDRAAQTHKHTSIECSHRRSSH